MKKLLLSVLTVVSAIAVNAHDGKWLLYGNAGFSTRTSSLGLDDQTQFNINPGIGYQFNKHWTLGLQGGFQMATIETLDTSGATLKTEISEWSAGVFGRYTHNFNSTFFAFGQLNAAYRSMESDFSTVTTLGTVSGSIEGSGIDVNFMPAIGINVYKGWALNFGVGGIGYRTTDIGITQSEFNFTFGQQFNFGLSKTFGCGHHKHGSGHDMNDAMRHDHMKMKDKHEDDDDDDE